MRTIKIEPEKFYGNKEYKRFFIPKDEERFEQLKTQMIWRLNEGNGIAYYYIGVDDDGTVANITEKEWFESKQNIEKMTKIIKSNIVFINKQTIENENNKVRFFVIKIEKFKKKLEEKRILLLGESGTGKSTFLAYIIKNKIGSNASQFIHNHKHEILSGNTSSFYYNKTVYKNYKLVFIDTPGYQKYIKTRHKIISAIDFDLVLLFYKKNEEWKWEDFYQKLFNSKNIPIIRLTCFNAVNKFPRINLLNPIQKNKLLDNIIKNFKNDKIEIINKEKNVIFNILSSYPQTEVGLIISGFLKSGKIARGKTLYYKTNKNIIEKYKILSIHIDGKSVGKLDKKGIATLLLNADYSRKIFKTGFLTNIISTKKEDLIIYIKYRRTNIPKVFVCYINNTLIKLIKLAETKDKMYCYTKETIYNSGNSNTIISSYFFGHFEFI